MRRLVARKQYRRNLQSKSHEPAGRAFFQSNWEPELNCALKERLGRMGDGGKWICDPHVHLNHTKWGSSRNCVVYSLGSSNDFSFENEFLQSYPHCEMHTFDHTSSPPTPRDNPAINFHNYGVAASTSTDGKLHSLRDILQDLNHTEVEVMKVDIEGHEYEVIAELAKGDASPLLNVRQILMEIHEPPLTANQVHDLMEKLHVLGFVIFNKEPNTAGCCGDCIEYSFVRLTKNFLGL
jgi:FkbM family methyltransferase